MRKNIRNPMTRKEVVSRLTGSRIEKLSYSPKRGIYTARLSFFYRHGYDESKFAANIQGILPEAQIISAEEHWNAWPRDSWWEVKFKV